MSVVVVQADSRADLFGRENLCVRANIKQSAFLGFNYLLKRIEPVNYVGYACLRYAKLNIILELLEERKYDFLVFLDTDAWIQNAFLLNELITCLNRSDKIGCFSREPEKSSGLFNLGQCFVNSGSFILKCNSQSLNSFRVISDSAKCDLYKNNRLWPNDQLHISNYVYSNKDNFFILKCCALNSPKGTILRHNWFKDVAMHRDLNIILSDSFLNDHLCFDLFDFIDSTGYDGPYKGCYKII